MTPGPLIAGRTWLEWAELLSYIVTIFGFPLALAVSFTSSARRGATSRRRFTSASRTNIRTSSNSSWEAPTCSYSAKREVEHELTEEQKERKLTLFNILVSLFERAYLLVYEDRMDKQTRRLWRSWEDYMREWCRRKDFRATLPELLQGA